ncbi:hypothetical protein [Streptomyces racemochromogenes]|uniref:hypothetical protein n=1 Tax=Streptomyces racemochromogenes TaxID=67353 RepID=UPI0031EE7662
MNLGLRGLGGPLYDGSVLLGRNISAWITAPKYRSLPEGAPEGTKPQRDQRAPVKRLGTLGGVAYVLVSSDYTTYAVTAGTIGWIVAALALSQKQDPAADAEESEGSDEDAAEHPEPAAAEPALGLIPDAVRHLAQGGHGAHLKMLAQHLTKTTRRPWDTAAVRAACKAAGIPITNSVRQPGRRVSTGVRLEDLPDPSPSPSQAPAVAVVIAGQEPPTEAATATTTAPPTDDDRTVEGVRMTLLDDPTNPARTHVTVHP